MRGDIMNLFDAVKERRAVKHYDPQHEITETEIEQLISTAILSPTSFNIQNWRFVVVKDKEQRQKLRAAAWDQAQVTDASLLIILCGDLKSFKKDPDRYWRNAPEDVQKMLVPMIGTYYEGREDLQRDEVMRSCGIVAQTIMLSAKAMGYDSCPMVGFDFPKVAELINLPKDHVISMMITVGKKMQDAHPRGGQLGIDEVVVYDSF